MYEEEIKNIIRPFIKKYWMSDEEVDETIELSIAILGGWDRITNDLIIGISNGYSIEQQLNISKEIIKRAANNE